MLFFWVNLFKTNSYIPHTDNLLLYFPNLRFHFSDSKDSLYQTRTLLHCLFHSILRIKLELFSHIFLVRAAFFLGVKAVPYWIDIFRLQFLASPSKIFCSHGGRFIVKAMLLEPLTPCLAIAWATLLQNDYISKALWELEEL